MGAYGPLLLAPPEGIWGPLGSHEYKIQDTRKQDIYLDISSYPEWVVYRKMPEQMLLKNIKVCKYK